MAIEKKFFEEEEEGYSLQVLGRSVYVTDAMKQYAWDKMSKVERLGIDIMHMQVTLDIQHLEHVCTIVAKFRHFPLKVQASSTDMYASIDRAIDRLQRQLRRWKGRIIDHNKKKLAEIDIQINVLRRPYQELDEINAAIDAHNQEIEESFRLPKIIGEESLSIKRLTTEEALMKIDLTGESFLVYLDEAEGKLKLLYQRPDRDYGLAHLE